MADMNQYRHIVFLLVLNLMIGVGGEIYENPTALQFDNLNELIDVGEANANVTISQESEPIGENVQEEPSAGNLYQMGIALFGLLIRGLNPFNTPTSETSVQGLGMLFGFGLIFFRVLLYFITTVMAYKLLKGK